MKKKEEKNQDVEKNQELETQEETAVTEGQQQNSEENRSALDKVLEDPDLRAEFDARVQEAVDAAIADASEEDGAADDSIEEDASDNPDSKSADEDSRTKDLDAREKSLMQRELRATAIEELSKEQLPAALADCFNYDSEESFRISKEKCIKAFQDAVKAAVNERLRGSRAPKASGEGAKGDVRKTSFADTINKVNRR